MCGLFVVVVSAKLCIVCLSACVCVCVCVVCVYVLSVCVYSVSVCVFYGTFIQGVVAQSKTYTFVYEFCLA